MTRVSTSSNSHCQEVVSRLALSCHALPKGVVAAEIVCAIGFDGLTMPGRVVYPYRPDGSPPLRRTLSNPTLTPDVERTTDFFGSPPSQRQSDGFLRVDSILPALNLSDRKRRKQLQQRTGLPKAFLNTDHHWFDVEKIIAVTY